ncbi:MAG: DUF302 domain-containing protein [Pseudomonadota bacterium]|nr:DUF302 domain-containing protein [Pseudomonadota bacterium]
MKALNGAIKDNGMFAVSKASASAGAKRRGIDIAGNMVIGVFRNDYAVRMLAASIEAGIEAPLRYYVTDDSDGTATLTYGTATLTYRTPSAVFAPYGKAELNEIAGELDAIFAAIAAQASASKDPCAGRIILTFQSQRPISSTSDIPFKVEYRSIAGATYIYPARIFPTNCRRFVRPVRRSYARAELTLLAFSLHTYRPAFGAARHNE